MTRHGRIAELTAHIVKLPLRRQIKHASFTRQDSANLIVRCRLRDGTEGWGEGVPRSYVTGETVETAMEMLGRTPLASQLQGDCDNWNDVIELCDRFSPDVNVDDPRRCGGNALRCAVELSLLDAFGKRFGSPIREVIRHLPDAAVVHAEQSGVRYSTTLTAEAPRAERISALKMRLYGFSQCKVKVGIVGVDDVARLNRIRRWIGSRIDLRLDANEAWTPDEVVSKMKSFERFKITSIEQPVAHGDVDALADIRKELRVPVMLDESLTGLTDARSAIEKHTCDLFNIRLSKCGGYLASLRLAAVATGAGLGFQLGCHPGESGILSAAGRHFASSVKGIRYLEGSYDRHLLDDALTREDITFGYGGRAPALTGSGLGVHVNTASVEKASLFQRSFVIS